jgi:hypothetical protein
MPGYLGVLQSKASRDLAAKQPRCERRPVHARVAHHGQRRREVALGETAAVFVGHQWMVKVSWLGEPE